MGAKNQIFISYAHEDVKWKDEFALMLTPAVRRGSISLWSDQNIPVGQDWAQSIDQALRSASVGLLLVTPQFLNSSFINNEELARLLNLAKTAGVAICWVPVSPSLYTETPLKAIQAAWDVSRPLDQMPPAQRGDAVYKICTEIVEKYGFLPRVTGRRRETLPRELQSRLADRYEVGGEIGAGQFSIVYRAQQKNPSRTVAVKLFVASEFDECANQTFKEAVKRGAELTSPAFVRMIEHSMDATPEFLVTEFVHGEPLPKYLLRYPQGLPLTRVRSILLDLASSLEEIHYKGWLRGEMCASNIMVDLTGKARLSTVDLSTVLSEQSLGAGTFNINRESLAYITPERFFGRPHTQATDQFSLGLIATELIGGEQIPRVNSPSDLELKRQVFRDLETGKGRWAGRSPELAGIVARMLRTNPDGRWPSMTDVRHFLRDVAIAESDEERNRSIAKAIYLRLQTGAGGSEFFERFYQNLFDTCPDVQAHFKATDMQRQHMMLNRAIQMLLDFNPARGSEQLRDLGAGHGALGLTGKHYELFLEVLVTTIEQSGTRDPEQLNAWRDTLARGVEFMRICQGESAAKHARPAGVS